MRTEIASNALATLTVGVLLALGGGCRATSSRENVVLPATADTPAPHEVTPCAPCGPDGGAGLADPDAPLGVDAAAVPIAYEAITRTIVSSGVERTFLLAFPARPPPAPAPLVIAFHGDGGSPDGMRAGLPLEEAANGAAVFAYPAAPDGTFRYWSVAGRIAEGQLVQDVVSLLAIERGIDTTRVFLSGFSGGATMANALACHLGPSVVRGVGVHSGTLYTADDYAGGAGGVSDCALPSALIVWGTADATYGTTYAESLRTRDRYASRLACAATTTAIEPSPCVSYDGCTAPLTWCAIEGHGHAVWSSAAAAMWAHFARLR